LIKHIKTVQNADSEIVGLYNINSKLEAVVQQKFKEQINYKDNYSGEGKIDLVSYKPNHLIYESDTKNEEFAIFSEIYYPKGWNVYVDGQISSHVGVDYVLRGMIVPAGRHKIEFKFEPQTYQFGNTIALIGSILLLLTIVISIYFSRKNNVIVS
jgi:uncharacterized membrane protein YfhO